MISLNKVSMDFPVSRSIRDYLKHPFQAKMKLPALKDINLEIEGGDRVSLLGPNGAGKTTLLKLIGGQLLPSYGKIHVNGVDTSTHNTQARSSVGFVINEERSFFWRLSGRENLSFFGTLDNLFGLVLKQRIQKLLDLIGLSEVADKPVSNYSSGMKQRLAIARGLIADPEVLILDEPTRALDPIACDELIALILDRIHADRNKTLLIATHRFDEVMKLSDKVMIINHGRLLSYDNLKIFENRRQSLADYYRNILQQRQEEPCY